MALGEASLACHQYIARLGFAAGVDVFALGAILPCALPARLCALLRLVFQRQIREQGAIVLAARKL